MLMIGTMVVISDGFGWVSEYSLVCKEIILGGYRGKRLVRGLKLICMCIRICLYLKD